MNRKERESHKRPNIRKNYHSLEDWIKYEAVEDEVVQGWKRFIVFKILHFQWKISIVILKSYSFD